MGDPLERLGSEAAMGLESTIKEELSMEIDPPLKENLATAEDWRKALNKVVPAVVVLRTTACRAFDTEPAGASYATGFVVDKRRGIILTNRHVVKPGPVVAEAMFVNREEITVHPIYRDPVHDFGFFRYNPDAIQFLDYEEIPLSPEAACVGLEIRVVGNDSGEKVSILAGTLARLDRDAPHYKKYDGYNDFNTFYMQAASGTKGGSSGSPVIDWQGRAVALNAGSKSSSASAFFLPLERVVRALKFLQKGGDLYMSKWEAISIPRGTLQATFVHKGFDEIRRLGLQSETEQIARHASALGETGMLVVDSVVPGGPAHSHLEPGDVLVRVNGEVITQFLKLETLLDDSVEQKIELEIERGGTPLSVQLVERDLAPQTADLPRFFDVQDLHSITPAHFLEVSGAVIHPLSYQQARNFRFQCGLVYVSEPGYMLFRAAVPRHAIIKKFAGEEISKLEDLVSVLSKLSRGARVPLEYISYMDRHRRKITFALDVFVQIYCAKVYGVSFSVQGKEACKLEKTQAALLKAPIKSSRMYPSSSSYKWAMQLFPILDCTYALSLSICCKSPSSGPFEDTTRLSVLVTVDCHEWYAPPQIYTRDDSSGLWTAKPAFQLDSMIPSSGVNGKATRMEHVNQVNHQELTDGLSSMETCCEHSSAELNSHNEAGIGSKKRRVEEDMSSDGVLADGSLNETGEVKLENKSATENAVVSDYPGATAAAANASIAEQVIEPTLVMFEVHVPPSCMLDGVHSQHFFGTGVIIYHSRSMGLVAVDKNTVAISSSDVMLSFAAYPIEIPGELVNLLGVKAGVLLHTSETPFGIDEQNSNAGAKELKNNGSLVVMAFVQRANSLEPECKTHIGLENLARSLIPNGNLITESDKEVDSTCPQNAESGFKEYSKADTPGVVGTFINDSETKDESPSMTETYSGIKVEPSLKGSLWILELDILGTGLCSLRDFTAESTNGVHDLDTYVEMVVFLHPVHNYALVAYDPSTLGPVGASVVRAAELLPGRFYILQLLCGLVIGHIITVYVSPMQPEPALRRGDSVYLVGLSRSLQATSRKSVVTNPCAALNIASADCPRYRATNMEVIELDTDFGSTFSGVLTDEHGRVRAIWGSFSTQLKFGCNTSEDHQFVRGIPAYAISQVLDKIIAGANGPPLLINGVKRPMPLVRILEVEFYPTLLSKARSFGLSDDWIQALVKKDPVRRQVLRVKGCLAGSKAENLLEQGDMVLAVNKEPVTCFRDIENACQALDNGDNSGNLNMTIFRQGREIDLLVGTDVRDGNGTARVINWCGCIVQDPHPAVRALGYLPEEGHGVYVARWCHGSPVHRYGLYALQWIVEINGKPTPDLDAFVNVTKVTLVASFSFVELEHGEFVRVRTVHLNGKPRVLTLKQDLHYWPTWELRFDPEIAIWHRRMIKTLDCRNL
ncbi:hypothetical protein GOBAR_AA09549 [Gossypium barbadense]|uniref:Pro-apoptotic serine protease NMA111 n=1 Tax=Gossypium barbadense TaxID=3634 RepID=A0A2P5Y666_GOSBA|nr:hypothetical protein GOBAR_AA09549 [Gossypium barbadense]